jgi:DNA-binding NarL/FixJ family response regulator
MEAAADRGRHLAVRVLIADDEPLFVEMVEALLADEEQIEVVASAQDGQQAVELARVHDPDVIVMDISMPVIDGIEATRQIHKENPDARILILTGSSTSADVDRSRTAGVSGFLTKDRIVAHLVESILDLDTSELP